MALKPASVASSEGASFHVRIKQFCCRQPWTCVALAAIAAVGVLFALKVLPLTFCVATCIAVGAVVALTALAAWKIFKNNHSSGAEKSLLSADSAASGTDPADRSVAEKSPLIAASAASETGPAERFPLSAASAASGTGPADTSSGPSFDREMKSPISTIRYAVKDGRFVSSLTEGGKESFRSIHQAAIEPKPLTIYIPENTNGVCGDPTKELTTKDEAKTALEVTEVYYIDCIQRLLAPVVSLEGRSELTLNRDNNIEFVRIAGEWAKEKFPGASSATISLLDHLSQRNYQFVQIVQVALVHSGKLGDYMLAKSDSSTYQTKISFKKVDGLLVADYEIREERLAYEATFHFTTRVRLTEAGYQGVGEISIEKIEGHFKPEYLAHLQRTAQE